MGDLQNRRLPLSQSQLKIGMLSRASTWCRQRGQKERRGWATGGGVFSKLSKI